MRHRGTKGAQSNPYRGWTLVERPGGLYMTRDNLRYVRVRAQTAYGDAAFGGEALHEFHRMVDKMGGR